MDYLPLFYRIQDRPCLVVGGGEVAARKVSMLLRAGGRVSVVAPAIDESGFRGILDDPQLELSRRSYQSSDLDQACLVVAATDDERLNLEIATAAKARELLVNVVDNPDLCNFIFPSIVDRDPVVVAVSSGGTSPVLARILRARIETLVPSGYGRLAALLGKYRSKLKRKLPSLRKRRNFWEEVVQGPIGEMVFSGQTSVAERLLGKAIEEQGAKAVQGEVALVGAGPGDPDLLTFRALRLLQRADVIIYDRLVSPAILEMARRDAERVYVGKERDRHIVPQEDINDLLARLALEGKRVVRLKGGDPFIFGRGGEEIERLSRAGVPFQVVPGITAGNGAAAYAGIPLTHRDCAQSVLFVTGHLKNNTMDLNWSALVQPNQTVVVYMGLVGLKTLCARLVEHGMPESTPVALVEKATTSEQRVHVSTLSEMPAHIENIEIHPPTLIIIGEVVRLHEQLDWFEPAGRVG